MTTDTMSIVDIEVRLDELFGPTQFDWTVGKTGDHDAPGWFWFAGTQEDSPGVWKYEGHSKTLEDALLEMLNIGEEFEK